MTTGKIQLPPSLVEAVKNTRVIPFLGAGASKEATDSGGNRPPDGNQLRDILATHFFGRDIPNRDLMAVAEMAIQSSGGQSLVFEEVRKALDNFNPGDAHRGLAEFNWRAIATTNYDLLVERAYSSVKHRRQNLVRFVKDDEPIEGRLQDTAKPLQYLKLHGCLEHIHDSDIPPILSKESYSRYSANRTRLFSRLEGFAHESTILFIGYQLDDPHLRNLIYKIAPGKRPRWFMVLPDAEDYDIDYWATQNVGIIKARFGEMMTALQDAIPPLFRQLAPSTQTADFPIRKHFQTNEVESDKLRNALARDFTFIHSAMPSEMQSPELFYQGYDSGWGAVLARYDVRRKVEEVLLFKAVLEKEDPSGPSILVIRGTAGAGKTVALKRTAFEAATGLDALVLWLNDGGAASFEVLEELYMLSQKPIYLFIDQLGFRVQQVLSLLRAAKASSLPLIIVGAERDADWSTYCGVLDAEFPAEFLRVGNLSQDEVEGLLDLLDRHNCLGLLKSLTRAEQINRFMDKNRADRQLLVALHELTQGKPFETIILEEHQRIFPPEAQQLYLDIATLHQFSVNVRAGIISRLSGISFEEFQQKFLEPLRNIVRVEEDPYSGDLRYLTRHPRVAAIVFRETCPSDAEKASQLIRIVECLDAGYSVDKRALEDICRGRTLAEQFSSIDEARSVLEAATKAAPKQAFLFQQWALLESNHSHGSFLDAERLAAEALDIEKGSKSILHTQAEIDRKRANAETSPLLKDSLRRRARERLAKMPRNDRFATSSRCKLLVDELVDLASRFGDSGLASDAIQYEEQLRITETAIMQAQQNYPDDPDIDQVEARFRSEIDQEDKALKALEQALSSGARGSGTPVRIAKMYEARGRWNEASKTLQEALARSPDDKQLNSAMAHHLMKLAQPDFDTITNYLRKSFTMGDRAFENRFDLAQLQFLRGAFVECRSLFAEIDEKAPHEFRKVTPRSDNVFTALLPSYRGTITSLKPNFAFIRSTAYIDNIYGNRSMSNEDSFDDLSIGEEVSFRLRFNRSGPTAVNIQPIH